MDIDSLIHRILSSEGGFAIYRTPEQSVFSFMAQKTAVGLWSESSVGAGFVVAPFAPSDATPAVVIRPEYFEERQLPHQFAREKVTATYADAKERTAYAESFARLYPYFAAGTVKKVVLARRCSLELAAAPSLLSLFFQACEQNPTCFVALWRTPQTGVWLVATPELLVRKTASEGHTMAIAGTMSADEDTAAQWHTWSDKNKEEQRQVADFIATTLAPLTTHCEHSTTYPQKVGQLVHLRTDFRFITPCSVAKIALALHPTPAVCGTPRAPALGLIQRIEPVSRSYYSGFCGAIENDGSAALYVSLRCMQLQEKSAFLYAGGGILAESQEAEEWQETCRKLRPMLSLFTIE